MSKNGKTNCRLDQSCMISVAPQWVTWFDPVFPSVLPWWFQVTKQGLRVWPPVQYCQRYGFKTRYTVSGSVFKFRRGHNCRFQWKKGWSRRKLTLLNNWWFACATGRIWTCGLRIRRPGILKFENIINSTGWFYTIFSTNFWFRLELFGSIWPWRAQFGHSPALYKPHPILFHISLFRGKIKHHWILSANLKTS
jgi:hypothetical protein